MVRMLRDPDLSVRGWDHEALWLLMRQGIANREPDYFTIHWTKGHATEQDIAEGRSTVEDAAGNDEADKLASAAASLGRCPEHERLIFRRWRAT
eukprot:8353652-Heterocapsa_arctica.AAC.1